MFTILRKILTGSACVYQLLACPTVRVIDTQLAGAPSATQTQGRIIETIISAHMVHALLFYLVAYE